MDLPRLTDDYLNLKTEENTERNKWAILVLRKVINKDSAQGMNFIIRLFNHALNTGYEDKTIGDSLFK